MIHTVWPYLAVMLLAAGLFPAVERRFNWRIFSVLPPIVLTYLLVTALAVSGLWQVNDEIRAAQSMLTTHMVPALLFLLMINCDLRAIWRSPCSSPSPPPFCSITAGCRAMRGNRWPHCRAAGWAAPPT